jgi:hypothetical protein
MKQLPLFILILLLVSCQSSKVNLKKLDRANPQNVAIAVLKSFKNKDLKTLQLLATPQHAIIIKKMLLSDEATKEQNLFTGSQWDKINNWKGKIKEVRFSDDLQTAYAMFFSEENATDLSEITVVRMNLVRKEWKFDNIISYTKKSFNTLGYVME